MSKSNSQKLKILLQVSGSIAAFKAVSLCSKLIQLGHEVEVILSEGAQKFVGAASFEGFTRKKAHTSLYTEGQMMAHIDLERWADTIILYPASANTIAKLATGQADCLISALYLAHEFKKPYLLAPAMNQAMFAHPSITAHLQTLKNQGVQILTPVEGFLACGEMGTGRVIEPEAVLNLLLAPKSKLEGKKILVTSGGTSEPIDPVRSITNFSTGETGHRIATELRQAGHHVTLIQARSSPFSLHDQLAYTTTDEFVDLVKSELQNHHYDYLIHSAAVADYRVENRFAEKIPSENDFTLKLVRNEKVIHHVREWSKNKLMKVVSFKLTSDSPPKLESYDSEWIIHNELKNVNREQHAGTIYNQKRDAKYQFKNKTELVKQVQNIIEGSIL